MSTRRVVITGIGAIASSGLNASLVWDSVVNGRSGIKQIAKFNTSSLSSKVAGELGDDFDPAAFIDPRDLRKMDKFIQYGVIAAHEAIQDSAIDVTNEYLLERTGVMIGSGIGGIKAVEDATVAIHSGARVSPYFIASCLINLISGHVSIRYGFRGPNHAVCTACATGAHAIGDASRIIRYGDADIMIAGGSEAPITMVGVMGFAASKALSTNFNDSPHAASRPWDKMRDGFVMSEGSGIVVLEEYEHAIKRGAKIYAEIVGYGMAGDAYHITSPHPDGIGAYSAMKNAIKDAKINISDIDYINAHGTSTIIGDHIELEAVQRMFAEANPKILMSSTKSTTGHLLGAAGSLEVIISSLAMLHNVAPPTINLYDPIDSLIDLVPNVAKTAKLNYAMTNSFGFGGTNTSIILKKLI